MGRSLELARVAVLLVALAVAAPGCGEADTVLASPFAPSVSWPTGLPARALAVLDAPSGKVALAFQLQDEVGVLDASVGDLNPAAARVGAGPMAIAALDADGNGTRDLVTANASDGTLSLIGQTASGLEVLATATLPAPPKHVCGTDLDGDGRQELIVTVGLDGGAESSIAVWRAADAALVPAGTDWPVAGAFAAATGDVDDDGDLDVIAVLQQSDEIAWATNDGAGVLTPDGRADVCRAPRAVAMVSGRIAVACRDGLALVRVSRDAASADEVTRVPYDGNAYDLAAGDFDGDGHDDLAAVDLDHDAVALWRGRADGDLDPPTLHPVGADPVALVAADLGGDGDLDLVVAAYATRTVDVLENATLRSP